jgi:uncharacterized membrane protein
VSQSSEFVAITLCVASRLVFVVVVAAVVVYFFIDSVRKFLDIPSNFWSYKNGKIVDSKK